MDNNSLIWGYMDGTSPSVENQSRHFSRTREVFKDSNWRKMVLGIASLVAVLYVVKTLLNTFFPESVSWILTVLPFGFLVFCYNMAAQATGKDIKYALVLDWIDLPTKIHFLVIAGSVASLYVINFFESIYNGVKNRDFKNTKTIASTNE